MYDCESLDVKDTTPWHGDVYDHPSYKYICKKCGKEVIPSIHCNETRCKEYKNQ